MSARTRKIILSNPHNHGLVRKVLSKIGMSVTIMTDDDDEDYEDYKLNDANSSLGVVGDNAIGAVVGAYMNDEDELIVITYHGNYGNYHYNVNTSKHLEILELVEL